MRRAATTRADDPTAAPATGPQPCASTLWADDDEEWRRAVHVADPRDVRSGWLVVLGLVREARRREVPILHGAVPARLLFRDLLAAVVVRWTAPRCHLLVTDATWTVASTAVGLRGGERTHHGVPSSDEQRTSAATWGVDPDRVHSIPSTHTLCDRAEQEPTGGAGHPSSGGGPERDHRLLEEASAGMAGAVRIAAAWRPQRPGPGLPVASVAPGSPPRRCVVAADPSSLRRPMEHVLDPSDGDQHRATGAAARASVLARHTPAHDRRSSLALGTRLSAAPSGHR